MRLDERGGDVLGAALGHQALREFDILGLMLGGGQQLLHQPFLIALAHIGVVGASIHSALIRAPRSMPSMRRRRG